MPSDNRNRRNGDIPVSRKGGKPQPIKKNPDITYRYEDLAMREKGQSGKGHQPQRKQPAPKPQNRSSADIYFDKSPVEPYKRQTYDYLDVFENNSKRDVKPDVKKKNNNGGEKAEKPKKKRGFFSAVKAVVFIVLVLYICATGYLFSIFSNVNYTDSRSGNIDGTSLMSDKKITNILLIGVDDRKGGTTSRSDTMMLVSVDRIHKQIKLTSFMRDTYVTVPGHGEDKMNSACTYGGPQLVVDTIEYNFGIDIDNYMLVDFNAFKEIVNSLGGVTVEVEQREAEYINRTSRQKITYGDAVKLNGDEALVFVRIRYLDSDFYRTMRQRRVISAIVDSAKKTNPFDLVKTGKSALKYIETDMSPMKMTLFSQGALFYLNYDIVQSRVPVDENYTNQTINGQAVLCIDREATAKQIRDFIFNEAPTENKQGE